MPSPPVVKGWGLIRVDRSAKAECLSVKDTVCDLPPFAATARYPIYYIKGCPCGVHGCCGGKMPCLEVK